jgi:hypothetical protein
MELQRDLKICLERKRARQDKMTQKWEMKFVNCHVILTSLCRAFLSDLSALVFLVASRVAVVQFVALKP